MGEGAIHVTSVREIVLEDITPDLARISGFDDVGDLLAVAQHGSGQNIYLVKFEYRR
jgi:hypothetical protein